MVTFQYAKRVYVYLVGKTGEGTLKMDITHEAPTTSDKSEKVNNESDGG